MSDILSMSFEISSTPHGMALHNAAVKNKHKIIRKLLEQKMDVDEVNAEGQTALFCACFSGRVRSVSMLLNAGADPNYRSVDRYTPVHAACYSGRIKILQMVLQAGGEMRFHDAKGRLPRQWCLLQSDAGKRRRMMKYLAQAKPFCSKCCTSLDTSEIQQNEGKANIEICTSCPQRRKENLSLGYSEAFLRHNRSTTSAFCAIPWCSRSELEYDILGATYDNGPYSMAAIRWKKNRATLKEVRGGTSPSVNQRAKGENSDHLLRECSVLCNLRHPNILLLLACCPTADQDGAMLIFESVGLGSLFFYLHETMEVLPTMNILQVSRQIAEVMLYLHGVGMLHCALNSHAVHIINRDLVKLGNFEHAVSLSDSEAKRASELGSLLTEVARPNSAIRHWMAPEVLGGSLPSTASELYSFCVLVLEMFSGEVPRVDKDNSTLILERGDAASLSKTARIPDFFRRILSIGLDIHPERRKLEFASMADMMIAEQNHMLERAESLEPRAGSTPFGSKSLSLPRSFDQRCSSLPRQRSAYNTMACHGDRFNSENELCWDTPLTTRPPIQRPTTVVSSSLARWYTRRETPPRILGVFAGSTKDLVQIHEQKMTRANSYRK